MYIPKISDVIVGGPVVFNSEELGKILKDSCFHLSYDLENQQAELWSNDGGGGRVILVIKNLSHESAAKLAGGMGLEGGPDKGCCFWGKFVPIIELCHDGSEAADTIKLEAFKLNIVCKVRKTRGHWAVNHMQFQYSLPYWPLEKVLEEMKKWAPEKNSL